MTLEARRGPLLSVRRKIVEQNYADRIEALYAGAEAHPRGPAQAR